MKKLAQAILLSLAVCSPISIISTSAEAETIVAHHTPSHVSTVAESFRPHRKKYKQRKRVKFSKNRFSERTKKARPSTPRTGRLKPKSKKFRNFKSKISNNRHNDLKPVPTDRSEPINPM